MPSLQVPQPRHAKFALQALQVAGSTEFLQAHRLLGVSRNKLAKVKFCDFAQTLEDFSAKATASELRAYRAALEKLVPECDFSGSGAGAESVANQADLDVQIAALPGEGGLHSPSGADTGPAATEMEEDLPVAACAAEDMADISSQRPEFIPVGCAEVDKSSKWSQRMSQVDVVFVVTSANKDLNLRRIERYLTVAHSLGSEPVVVINKAELADDIECLLKRVREVAHGVLVLQASTCGDPGLQAIRDRLEPGKTFAFIGSSGVGKSSITNALIGRENQWVQGIRGKDSRGRHTTTARTSFELANGSIIVDTPGMRAVEMEGGMEIGLSQTFADLETLAGECEFRDCKHGSEPGCALRAAERDRLILSSRLNSYLKLHKEIKSKATERRNQR